MDSERWKRVDNLLQAALERAPGERDAFLRQACAGDEAIEREVRSLLASQQRAGDRKSTRLNSSHLGISYAVFCLKKKKHVSPAHPDTRFTPPLHALYHPPPLA